MATPLCTSFQPSHTLCTLSHVSLLIVYYLGHLFSKIYVTCISYIKVFSFSFLFFLIVGREIHLILFQIGIVERDVNLDIENDVLKLDLCKKYNIYNHT